MNTANLLVPIGLVALILQTPILAFSTSESFFPVNSSPYGKSYQEWMTEWWKWYTSVDKRHSPNFEGLVEDHQQVACSYNQNQSDPVFYLWFINPDFGQTYEMNCDVPSGKAVAVPIDLGLMDYGDPKVDPKTPENLERIVKETNIYPNEFAITLDGVPVDFTNDETNRITSDPFNITLPEDNLWYDHSIENDTSVADGWLLLLKPLSPGEHILKYIGGYRDHESDPTIPVGQGNKNPYLQEVTYRLNVR